MRDLATYESNFGENMAMRDRLNETHGRIQRAMNLFKTNSCWNQENFDVSALLDHQDDDELDQNIIS
jgi:hypothetical protein